MYSDRVKNFELLEKELDAKVLLYVTSDRPGFATQIAQDVIDIFIEQLDQNGIVDRIVLYLYTRGGDTAAAWNIVNLLRMYCEELIVVIPHKAHSAGTIISLGANRIIMTKQATLSPIDPSLITSLNPRNPIRQDVELPVSVEAVNGYIELAKSEFGIKSDAEMANVLMKLSEYVHPLVLGQVYRLRTQIKMLARRLLINQKIDEEKVNKIIEFLCSDSGSHDYTINRREAKNELGLNIQHPTDQQYQIIKAIYDDIYCELELGRVYDSRILHTAYSVRRGLIESIKGGAYYHVTEGRVRTVTTKDGKKVNQPEKVFEGWKKEVSISETVENVFHEKGDVSYVQEETYKL